MRWTSIIYSITSSNGTARNHRTFRLALLAFFRKIRSSTDEGISFLLILRTHAASYIRVPSGTHNSIQSQDKKSFGSIKYLYHASSYNV